MIQTSNDVDNSTEVQKASPITFNYQLKKMNFNLENKSTSCGIIRIKYNRKP